MPEKIGEQSDGEQQDSFDAKKKKFFIRIGLGVRDAFKMHKEAGLWDWDDERERNWKNVSEHCLVETARVQVFADKLGFSEDLKRDLTVAAALHDFYKKGEIDTYDEEGMTWESYEKAEEKASELLEKKNFNSRIIKLVGSVGFIAGAEKQKILKKEHLSQDDIAFLVLGYVDDYTCGSNWANASEIGENGSRINDIDNRIKGAASRYEFLNESGRSYFNGELPSDVQIRTSHLIEKRIANIISAKEGTEIIPEDLPYLIDQEIKNRIESQ